MNCFNKYWSMVEHNWATPLLLTSEQTTFTFSAGNNSDFSTMFICDILQPVLYIYCQIVYSVLDWAVAHANFLQCWEKEHNLWYNNQKKERLTSLTMHFDWLWLISWFFLVVTHGIAIKKTGQDTCKQSQSWLFLLCIFDLWRLKICDIIAM